MTAALVWAAVSSGDVLGFAATVAAALIAGTAALLGVRASTRSERVRRQTAIDIAAINATVERQRADQAAAAELRRTDLEQVAQLRSWHERLLADHRAEIDRLQRVHDRTLRAHADQLRHMQARIAALEEALRLANVPLPP